MKTRLLTLSFIFSLVLVSALIYSSSTDSFFNSIDFHKEKTTKKEPKFQEGDIIFQTSNSMQSQAIQLATKSKFSHVGMIVSHKGKLVVLEAVQPVKYTPINTWIHNGQNADYSLKRLAYRDSMLTDSVLEVMRVKGNNWIGKNYDLAFDWSDKQLYCSELVWKMYQSGCGIELGKTRKLKDYDLSHPIVKQVIKQRYGNNIPLEENMISPQAIFESDWLIDVK